MIYLVVYGILGCPAVLATRRFENISRKCLGTDLGTIFIEYEKVEWRKNIMDLLTREAVGLLKNKSFF